MQRECRRIFALSCLSMVLWAFSECTYHKGYDMHHATLGSMDSQTLGHRTRVRLIDIAHIHMPCLDPFFNIFLNPRSLSQCAGHCKAQPPCNCFEHVGTDCRKMNCEKVFRAPPGQGFDIFMWDKLIPGKATSQNRTKTVAQF